MLVPGVATGVVKLDGNSDVKMVAVEGDKTYLELRTDIRLEVNPGLLVSHRPWCRMLCPPTYL